MSTSEPHLNSTDNVTGPMTAIVDSQKEAIDMTNSNPVTRSTSVAEWLERQERNKARFEESIRRGLAYQPQLTDVFISPYAKCGTTWLRQIVHGLKTTRGDMDFDGISRVVPWLETPKCPSTIGARIAAALLSYRSWRT